MFSLSSVCDRENVDDNQTVSVLQSHEVVTGGDMVQDHVMAYNSQGDQTIDKPVNAGIQESYVSLLTDAPSVDKTQEFSNTHLDASLNDTNQFNVANFTSKQQIVGDSLPTSLQNDSLIVQENQNTEYGLTSQTSSGNCFPQLVLLHNFTPAVINSTDDGNNAIFHIPNSIDPGMIADVASNQELEEAVANIDSFNNNNNHTSDVLTNDQSYLVSTNKDGEIQNIQIVQGTAMPTYTEVPFKEPKKQKSLRSVRKRTSQPTSNSKQNENSTEVRKFTVDELSNEGKTKQQLFEEYLGMTDKNLPKKKNVNKVVTIPEMCDTVENVTDVIHVCIEKTPEPNELIKQSDTNASEISEPNTGKADNVTDTVDRKSLDNTTISQISYTENNAVLVDDSLKGNKHSVMDYVNVESELCENISENPSESFTSLKNSKGYGKSMDSEISIKKVEKGQPILVEVGKRNAKFKKQAYTSKRKTLKRKHQSVVRNVKQPKKDSDTTADNCEGRLLDNFCWIYKTENKCILKLKPVTLKLMEPNKELIIELYVEDNIKFNSISQSVTTSGLVKHCIHFEKEEKHLGVTVNDASQIGDKDDMIKNKQSTIVRKTRNKKISPKSSKKILRSKTSAVISKKPLSEQTFEIPQETSEQIESNFKDSTPVITNNVFDSLKPVEVKTNVFADDEDVDKPAIDSDMNIIDGIETEVLDNDDNDDDAVNEKDGNGDDDIAADDLSGSKSDQPEKVNAKKDYIIKINELGHKIFVCPICGYFSKYPQNANKHIRDHTATRDWTCEICGLGFKSNNGLQKHKIKHKPDRPFKCRLCPKMFKSKGVLKQHLQRHLELKQYVCEFCSKGFVTNGDLNKHQRSHTGDMPYHCNMCEKKYSDVSALYRHQRDKHSNQLTCPQCSERFPTEDKLLRHTRLSHSDNETTTGPLISDRLFVPSLEPANSLIDSTQTESIICGSVTML